VYLIAESAFAVLLCVSLGAVTAGATYLLVMLIKEWRSGDLW
jgi:hypothetical protein